MEELKQKRLQISSIIQSVFDSFVDEDPDTAGEKAHQFLIDLLSAIFGARLMKETFQCELFEEMVSDIKEAVFLRLHKLQKKEIK